jgi:hypothetical protein
MRTHDDGVRPKIDVRAIVAAWMIYLVMLLGALVYSIFVGVPSEPSESMTSVEAGSIARRADSGPCYGFGDPESHSSSSAKLKGDSAERTLLSQHHAARPIEIQYLP